MQDMFITRVTTKVTKNNKNSRRKKQGWFTKEAMVKELGWSSPLVFNFDMGWGFHCTCVFVIR